nr:unnamed protein product [Callosobruchus analis]
MLTMSRDKLLPAEIGQTIVVKASKFQVPTGGGLLL